LQNAAIEGLTLHGLRRSFSLLGEAAGAPAGAIAQVMGHKPSATAEGYRPRSIDALRPFLEQIEAHVLSLARGAARSAGAACWCEGDRRYLNGSGALASRHRARQLAATIQRVPLSEATSVQANLIVHSVLRV